MTNQTIPSDQAAAPAEGAAAPSESARRVRGRDADPKSLALILAAVAAGAAVLLGALAGHATSMTACEDAVRAQVRAAMLGDAQRWGDTPAACAGIPDAEVDAIAGQILGKAFAG